MAKKVKEKKNTINNVPINNNAHTFNFTAEDGFISMEINKNEEFDVSKIDINSLLSYEKACTDICAKYELSSHTYQNSILTFYKFRDIHLLIQNEIEQRVSKLHT
jgi:hypothetical protein